MRIVLLCITLSVFACGAAAPRQNTGVVTAERDSKLPDSFGAIGGQVSDAVDGRPLSMAAVQAERDGTVVADDISDYQGRYRLGPLEPGSYTVRARFAETRMEFTEIRVVATQEHDLAIALSFQASDSDTIDSDTGESNENFFGIVEGVVRDDSDGTVFPGTVVSLVAPHLKDAPMAISDEQGRFRFRGLRPGKYSLSCYYQLIDEGNVEIRQNNVEVQSGQVTKVTLSLDLQIRLQ